MKPFFSLLVFSCLFGGGSLALHRPVTGGGIVEMDATSARVLNEILQQLQSRRLAIAHLVYAENTTKTIIAGTYDDLLESPQGEPIPPKDETLAGRGAAIFDYATERCRIVSSHPHFELVNGNRHRLRMGWSDDRIVQADYLHYVPEDKNRTEASEIPLELFRHDQREHALPALGAVNCHTWLGVHWSTGRVFPICTAGSDWKRASRSIWEYTNEDALHPNGLFGPDNVTMRGPKILELQWSGKGMSSILRIENMSGTWLPTSYVSDIVVLDRMVDRAEFKWLAEDDGWKPLSWHFVNTSAGELDSESRGTTTKFEVSPRQYSKSMFPALPPGLIGKQNMNYYIADETGRFVDDLTLSRSGILTAPQSNSWRLPLVAAFGVILVVCAVSVAWRKAFWPDFPWRLR